MNTKNKNDMPNLAVEKLLYERDVLIRQLWTTFNNLSYEIKINEWTDEDLDLWTKITNHRTIQDRLEASIKGE
jgi:hypothetical protein